MAILKSHFISDIPDTIEKSNEMRPKNVGIEGWEK